MNRSINFTLEELKKIYEIFGEGEVNISQIFENKSVSIDYSIAEKVYRELERAIDEEEQDLEDAVQWQGYIDTYGLHRGLEEEL